MPYDGEFSQYEPLRRIANDDKVKTLLERSRIQHDAGASTSLPQLNLADIKPSRFRPTHIIAIDGSMLSSTLKDGFPSAEVGYITIASVILDLKLLDTLDQQRPINPVAYRKTEEAESLDGVFPGCNIVIDTERTAKASFRKVFYEILKDKQLFDDGETLLDTYEALLAYKPIEEQRCPYADMYDDDCLHKQHLYHRGNGSYTCACLAQYPLYSTDALRIHERFHPDDTNSSIYSEVMQVLERLWLIHILRGFERHGYLPLLKTIAFVMDGPLAVFGQPAWLSQAISKELQRINTKAHTYTDHQDMLIVGIEKTGVFVNHFDQLVRTMQQASSQPDAKQVPFNQRASNHMHRSLIPPQTVCLLTDRYIKRNIIYSESTRPYGRQTYFGRKLFYRTKSGAQIVASIPFYNEAQANLDDAKPAQYPRLADALALFDQLVSSRYPNSLAPVVSAHAEAAIPLNLGKKVLETMARELMKKFP